MNYYKIICTVSGGVTGFRTAFLKNDRTGNDAIFAGRTVAEAEAERLRTVKRVSKARFTFTVVSA